MKCFFVFEVESIRNCQTKDNPFKKIPKKVVLTFVVAFRSLQKMVKW